MTYEEKYKNLKKYICDDTISKLARDRSCSSSERKYNTDTIYLIHGIVNKIREMEE